MNLTSRNRPVSPERLAQARALFEDGASQREVQRTTGIGRGQLRKYFPGQRWTYRQAGEFRQLTKDIPLNLKGSLA
ncbi:DNA binding protein [Arthrobacter phage TripleJ]|uniref:Helix-turn-helix DNA binding domain protein n=1 Tax=Arthrobacter phage TripleJ TaxID=2599838 RepID=A0A5J6TFG3_9CAUD|nr:DNA binding protein [Arthrobacter phage TripleJ]QFG09603.1 helix-turn-helix DNA binding domain protein [Arthrobacter phage TripleJ]